MLIRTIIIALLALGGTAHAACPTGADVEHGIVLTSKRDSTYHHRTLDPEGTLVWQATGVYGSPPSRSDASVWLYDHGLLTVRLGRRPVRDGVEAAMVATYDGTLSGLDPWSVGARLQLIGTRTRTDNDIRSRLIDTFEVLGSETIGIGACDYNALIVRHAYQQVMPDGDLRQSATRKHWIPELRLIAQGSVYGNRSGYQTIRKREPGDWFDDNTN